MASNHQLVNQTSGKTEWYTPPHIVEAARQVMGTIDLDPASCARANERIVKAAAFYTSEDDGLSRPWHGRVWMNHPFGRKQNPLWIEKLVHEYKSGNITEACCITYAAMSEVWFRPLKQYPMCFIDGRVQYLDPETLRLVRGVTKGSVVTYLGYKVRKFAAVFSELGTVMVPWREGLAY